MRASRRSDKRSNGSGAAAVRSTSPLSDRDCFVATLPPPIRFLAPLRYSLRDPMMFYRLLRPLVFALDPERAHRLVMAIMEAAERVAASSGAFQHALTAPEI